MADKMLPAKRVAVHAPVGSRAFSWPTWLLAESVAVAPISLAYVATAASLPHVLIYLAVLALALATQQLFIWAVRRRIGPERSTPADLLTLARASVASSLAGLAVAGFTSRVSLVGWLAFAMALLAATATDWVDGPLARRLGPTRLGGVLDIEADSWLTLWCAVAAVAWGGLPWWCLLPPLVRYAHPVRALLAGGLPAGGGPWWSRATGVAQMALLFAALLPVEAPWRGPLLLAAAIPISGAQLVAMLVLLAVAGPAKSVLLLPGERVHLAGSDGADAKPYHEQDVRRKVRMAEEARKRQTP